MNLWEVRMDVDSGRGYNSRWYSGAPKALTDVGGSEWALVYPGKMLSFMQLHLYWCDLWKIEDFRWAEEQKVEKATTLFGCINRCKESSLREVMLLLPLGLVLSLSWFALRRTGTDWRSPCIRRVTKGLGCQGILGGWTRKKRLIFNHKFSTQIWPQIFPWERSRLEIERHAS